MPNLKPTSILPSDSGGQELGPSVSFEVKNTSQKHQKILFFTSHHNQPKSLLLHVADLARSAKPPGLTVKNDWGHAGFNVSNGARCKELNLLTHRVALAPNFSLFGQHTVVWVQTCLIRLIFRAKTSKTPDFYPNAPSSS